jgi:hypothetical protein
MTPKRKKTIIVVSSVLVISAVIAYVLYKKKQEKKALEDAANTPAPDLSLTNQNNTNVAPISYGTSSPTYVKPKTTTTPKPTSNGAMVKLTDVLAQGLTSADNKTLYASVSGLNIYNMQGQVAWKTKKGEILGAIRSATSSGRVTFRATNGVNYYTSAVGMLVKL